MLSQKKSRSQNHPWFKPKCLSAIGALACNQAVPFAAECAVSVQLAPTTSENVSQSKIKSDNRTPTLPQQKVNSTPSREMVSVSHPPVLSAQGVQSLEKDSQQQPSSSFNQDVKHCQADAQDTEITPSNSLVRLEEETQKPSPQEDATTSPAQPELPAEQSAQLQQIKESPQDHQATRQVPHDRKISDISRQNTFEVNVLINGSPADLVSYKSAQVFMATPNVAASLDKSECRPCSQDRPTKPAITVECVKVRGNFGTAVQPEVASQETQSQANEHPPQQQGDHQPLTSEQPKSGLSAFANRLNVSLKKCEDMLVRADQALNQPGNQLASTTKVVIMQSPHAEIYQILPATKDVSQSCCQSRPHMTVVYSNRLSRRMSKKIRRFLNETVMPFTQCRNRKRRRNRSSRSSKRNNNQVNININTAGGANNAQDLRNTRN